MSAPVGVILAGGASSRMGTDKSLLPVDGRPMVLLVADALRAGGCAPVWCQGGDQVRLGRLGFDVNPDHDAVGDAERGRPGRAGPVRAIAAALDAATGRTVVVAACDLPRLTGDVVRSLVRVSSSHAAVAVATSAGRRHLIAAWPGDVVRRVQDAIDRGTRSYGDLLTELGAVEVEVDPELVHNVNRPGDVPGATAPQRYPRAAMTVHEISVDELAPLLAAGARLVDVREPDEYEEARVPGGVLIPLADVPRQVDAFRSDGTTYVICRSGARSMRACELLAAQGVDVANVAGGTLAWIASGRDVAAGPA